MNIFSKLQQGDSASWDDYPFQDSTGKSYDSSVYALKYEIRGPAQLTLNAVADGNAWKTTLSLVDSATLVPGTYYWAAYATAAGERVTAGKGTFVIEADLAVAGANYDGRSDAEKTLASINSQLLARANGDFVTEYAIGDRSLKKEPTAELLAMKSRFEAIVRAERQAQSIANGLGNPRRVMVRFG